MGGHIDNRLFGEPASITTATISSLTASKPVFTDASKLLVSTGTMPVNQGGTNITSYAIGDLLYASTTGVLSKLADVATGQYLASGGVGVAPAYATLNQAAVAGLTTASSPSFTNVGLGTGELTAGSVNRAADTLTLEIAGTPVLSVGAALVTAAQDVVFNQAAYFDAVQTATGDGTTTIDWGLGNKFVFTFGAANETFTFTAPGGPCSLTLVMIQDGTGSRTATWPGTVKWPSNGTAPTLSTDPADIDIVTFFYDGVSVYYGQGALDFD